MSDQSGGSAKPEREWWAMESKLDKGPPVIVSNERAEKYGAKDVNWNYFKVIEHSALTAERQAHEETKDALNEWRRRHKHLAAGCDETMRTISKLRDQLQAAQAERDALRLRVEQLEKCNGSKIP